MGQIKNKTLLRAIALQFKKIREEKKISQEIVFYDTQIHIARIETGKQNITVSTLDALCRYFQIPMSKFFKEIEKFS